MPMYVWPFYKECEFSLIRFHLWAKENMIFRKCTFIIVTIVVTLIRMQLLRHIRQVQIFIKFGDTWRNSITNSILTEIKIDFSIIGFGAFYLPCIWEKLAEYLKRWNKKATFHYRYRPGGHLFFIMTYTI